jgi:FkbH-like protein
MSPAAFLQRPLRWLEAVSRDRATTSGGPNFAYDLCARKATPKDLAALDLSCWQVAFNGAEPVRSETLRRFAETFAPCGFRPEAFYPCYGLAEATLFVTGSGRGRGALEHTVNAEALASGRALPCAEHTHGAQILVSSGRNHDPRDQRLLVVHPETRLPCAPGDVGEIWIASPSVARGYWNRTEESDHTFGAQLASGDGPFLRTGDLGFLVDDELFVTGRLKDLIIIRGRNLYPHDLELTCERAHPAIRPGCCAAFSIEVDRQEQLIVTAEVELRGDPGRADAIVDAVRRAIAEEYAVQAHAVVLLEPRSIPKTSSGKIQRRACRDGFLGGTLASLAIRIAPRPSRPPPVILDRTAMKRLGPTERQAHVLAFLVGQAAQRLQLDPSLIDPHKPLVDHGLDSLSSMELRGTLEADLGVSVPVEDLLEQSLAALAGRFVVDAPVTASIPRRPDRTESPLSAEQQRLWLLDQMRPGNPAYNLPLAYRLTGPLDLSALTRAMRDVALRHEVLRTRMDVRSGTPIQILQPPRPLILSVIDLSDLDAGERNFEARRLATAEASRPFDLTRDVLLRVGLLRLAEHEHWLLVTTHHIACDLWSTTVLIEEFVNGYRAACNGTRCAHPELPIHYADFAAWQAAATPRDRDLAYWQRQLAHATPLLLPTDQPRSKQPSFRGGQHAFRLTGSPDVLRSFSQAAGVTPFMVLLTAFQTLLHRWARQDDITLGSPVSGRTRSELERVVGFFAYPLVLRANLSGNPTFREALARVRRVALDAYAHQEVPFSRVVELARAERSGRMTPLVQVLFGFLDRPIVTQEAGGVRFEPQNLGRDSTDFELFLTLFPGDHGLHGTLEYNADLFSSDTMAQLAVAFCQLLATALEAPETRLADFALPPSLAHAAVATPAEETEPTLAISATFTAEPVQDILAYWLRELELPSRLVFTPYHQVFQQLIDEHSVLSRNAGGVNVLLLRFDDWVQAAQPVAGAAFRVTRAQRTELQRKAREFVEYLALARSRAPTPYLVCVCPSDPVRMADPGWAEVTREIERKLAVDLAALRNVHLVSRDKLAATYPVADYAAVDGEALGHIPFKPVFYAALGTMLARKVAALRRAPYKVIVVDCDNTLWRGVVSEDGPQSVRVDGELAAFHGFLQAQHDAGMLLCLCSKNNEADVLEVFEQRADLPLRLHHFVAHRINWDAKSANLRSLAAELRLGLDSFMFIDDDAVMCAEVRQNCPEVLTLQFPSDPADIAAFQRHLWALDRLEVTAEDQQRTALYRRDLERQQARQTAPSLVAFIASLELQVRIAAPQDDQLARVAQLTQRTNQLNVSGIRRQESEIRELLRRGELEARCVEVRDRFGDYGLVGVMLFAPAADRLIVDTFLLSCRAMGRAVESRMLVELGAIARERELAYLEIRYRRSAKNQPALDLLSSAGAIARSPGPDSMTFELSAATLATSHAQLALPSSTAEIPDAPVPIEPARQEQAEVLRRIAAERWTPEQTLDAIRKHNARRRPELATSFVAPRTPTERAVAEIWHELLSIAPIGVADDFFALGGHSLLAAQFVSRVRESLHVELPLTILFDSNATIGALARAIEDLQIEQADVDVLAEAARELEGLSDEEVRSLLAQESMS